MKLFTGKRILYVFFAVMVLMGGAVLYLEQFLQLDTYKDQLLAELTAMLHRKVSYGTGVFSLSHGPQFTFTNVTITERDGTNPFLHADRLNLRVALLPLLEKKVIIKKLELDTPSAGITRYPDGSLSVSDLLEQTPSSVSFQVNAIKVTRGAVNFMDLKVSPQGVRTILTGVELALGRLSRGKKGNVLLAATLGDGRHTFGSLAVKGSVKLAPVKTALDCSELDLDITAAGLEAGPFWPYYSRHVPFKKIEGKLTTDSAFKGELRRFSARGSLQITGARFDYQPVFHAVLQPKSVAATYTLDVSPDVVDVKTIDATVDGVRIKGSCAIRDLTTKDPRIVAKATSTPIRLEDFSRYIPYGVIVKEPSEFIEQKIKGGILRVVDGSLDGRISQILFMEKGTNYNVLAVRGTIEKGIVDWGNGVPPFTDIKGNLELAGKDFTLKQMSGRFGSSPFTLDGALKDYPVESPTLYPFAMTITPAPADIAWLFRIKNRASVLFTGTSTLNLTGDGPTRDYHLSGSWDLASASYTLPEILTKPAGMANSATFRLDFTPDRAELKEGTYQLPPLTAKTSAQYLYDEEQGFAFTVTTNQFALDSLAPLAPRISKYKPRGNVQATLRGRQPEDPDQYPVALSGSVSFAGASLSPGVGIKPLTELNGSATFTDSRLETSLISTKLGSTTLYGKITINDFSKPSVNVTFSSPLVKMADLGFKGSGREFSPSRVRGSVTLQEQSLKINSLSTQINNTSLDVTGTVSDLRRLTTNLAVTSPHLEVDDILPLTRLEPEKPAPATAAKPSLKISVKADTGSYQKIAFEKLTTELTLEGGILYLQPLECRALGGTVNGNVRIDTGSGDAARYQAGIDLRSISSQDLLKSLGMKKQELWGSLSAHADLSARGGSSETLKKSLLGSLTFRIEKGSIRRFSTLAKIFSILNVSQLLKMRAPEMVSGGMPFSEITGSVAVKDGIFSTSDLFVKSEAMNISTVGSMDLPRDRLDAIVGVQPFQTVDTVVNHIPIVGWILTGKDKSWITSYFEVTGPIGDPQVSVKTVSTMATGVLNIFKRVFQLPAKLFTDTGAVILGQ